MIGRQNPVLPQGPAEYLVAGLGNPGRQYESSRHNVGFIALDKIAEQRGFKLDRLRFKSLVGEGMIAEKKVLFMKPSTFMNLSGEAVSEALSFYKLPIERLLVINDDISLAPGKIRIRQKGSHGGHNGLKNIIQLCGSDNFARVKIGVGEKPTPEYDLASWVLATPSAEDCKLIEERILNISDIVELWVQGKTNEAMNKYN